MMLVRFYQIIDCLNLHSKAKKDILVRFTNDIKNENNYTLLFFLFFPFPFNINRVRDKGNHQILLAYKSLYFLFQQRYIKKYEK